MSRRLGTAATVGAGIVSLAAVTAALLPGSASERAVAASTGEEFLFGFGDDAVKVEPDVVVGSAHALGAGALRITLVWRNGRTTVAAEDAKAIADAVAAARDLRLVLSVHGETSAATPSTDGDRDAYCAYVLDALARQPQIRDVVIWNEPNRTHFWSPQFEPDGTSAAPVAYMRLLARCWDVLHAALPDVNVVAPATAPRGTDRPGAPSGASHSPGAFIRKLGSAYRASGRSAPLFDTVGHHVYPTHSAERPWRRHALSTTIGQGDWRELMQALWDAFDGTGQPIPGECRAGRCVSIWYLGAGYQTIVDEPKAGLYAGRMTERYPIPDWGGGERAVPAPAAASLAPDQATQIVDAVTLAYCQPYVGAFFNFLLIDEPALDGWQSGALWTDGTRKDSWGAFRSVIRRAREGRIDCAGSKAGRVAGAFTPTRGVELLRVEWPKRRNLSVRNDVWRFAVSAGEDARFEATFYRLGGGAPREQVARTTGAVERGRRRVVRLPARRVPPGSYQLEIVLASAANEERTATRTSPTLAVGEPVRGPRPTPRGRGRGARVTPEIMVSAIGSLPPAPDLEPRAYLGAPRPLPPAVLGSLAVRLTNPEEVEGAVVREINRVRRRRGLRALRSTASLARAGDAHARTLALAGLFTHDWPDGRRFPVWIRGFYPQTGYASWSAGENLLWTSGRVTPAEAVRLWLNSPSHRRILLSTRWREIGVGVVGAIGATGAYGGLTVQIAAAEFGVRG